MKPEATGPQNGSPRLCGERFSELLQAVLRRCQEPFLWHLAALAPSLKNLVWPAPCVPCLVENGLQKSDLFNFGGSGHGQKKAEPFTVEIHPASDAHNVPNYPPSTVCRTLLMNRVPSEPFLSPLKQSHARSLR